MRMVLPALLLATPLHAWEAVPGPVCTLTHEAPDAAVRLTYDPRVPEYAITITRRAAPWAEGDVFALRFDGPRSNMISTDRQVLSDGGMSLTVTDRGFGNVLDGLQFNDTATALIGEDAVSLSLDGAAPAVQAFRDCETAPSA
jgi:hypothetical protein